MYTWIFWWQPTIFLMLFSCFIALWKHTCRPNRLHVLSELFNKYYSIPKLYNIICIWACLEWQELWMLGILGSILNHAMGWIFLWHSLTAHHPWTWMLICWASFLTSYSSVWGIWGSKSTNCMIQPCPQVPSTIK